MKLCDVNEVYKVLTDYYHLRTEIQHEALKEAIERVPTVDAEPIRHGRWIRNDNETYSCSECHSWIPDEQHYYARYCLFCGAKMDDVWEEPEINPCRGCTDYDGHGGCKSNGGCGTKRNEVEDGKNG